MTERSKINRRHLDSDAECVRLKLMASLAQHQARLGTDRETPEDLERVVRIAHDLKNIATISALSVELFGGPAASAP